MAEVYERIKGEPIERVVANCDDVQEYLETVATDRGARASGILAGADRRTGDSKIRVESNLSEVNYGHIDWFVTLDDTGGLEKAATIEYGRFGDEARGVSSSKPVAPLRKAFGLLEGG